MKSLKIIFAAFLISSISHAASFDCTAKLEARSMTLRDGGAGAKKSAMIFQEGTWESHCPFTRGKVEDKTTKGVRKLTVGYKRAGNCSKPLPGQTKRAALNLVIEVKGTVMTAAFDDPGVNSGAPCELKGFTIKSLGLKK